MIFSGTYRPGAYVRPLVDGDALRLYGTTSGYVGFAPATAAGSTVYTLPAADGANGEVLTTDGAGGLTWTAAGGGGGASTALDNLAGVAINTSLISDTDLTDDLGSSSIWWNNSWVNTMRTREIQGNASTAAVLDLSDSVNGTYHLYTREGWSWGLHWSNNSALMGFNGVASTGQFAFGYGVEVSFDAPRGAVSTQGTSHIVKSAETGGDWSFVYDGTEVLRDDGTDWRVLESRGWGLFTAIGDTNPTSALKAGGIEFGAGGGTATDVSLARTAADELTLGAGDTLLLGENAVVELDSDLSADGKFTGTVIPGTAGATLAFGDLCYLSSVDSRWELADASADSTSGVVLVGICVLAAASDGSATKMLVHGTIRADAAFPALTVGAPVYVSTTAGDIVVTAPAGSGDVVRIMGHAIDANTILFAPDGHRTVNP